ncbi:MAG: bifunctional DNA primase/polymerase [Bifidobacterium pseudocatenulatum]
MPLGDCFVIDCDKPSEDGGPDGWQCLQALTGDYGTDMLPATLVTKTPHGMHLYYRMPAGMDIGLLKNAVHEQNLPIDLRVSNKGYVLGPGSVIDGKRYELVDLPAGVVPEASEAVMRMLKDYGYERAEAGRAANESGRCHGRQACHVDFQWHAGYDASAGRPTQQHAACVGLRTFQKPSGKRTSDPR